MKLPDELQFMVNARLPQKTTRVRMDGKVCAPHGCHLRRRLPGSKTPGTGWSAPSASLPQPRTKATRVQEALKQSCAVEIDVLQADFSQLDEVRQQQRGSCRVTRGSMC